MRHVVFILATHLEKPACEKNKRAESALISPDGQRLPCPFLRVFHGCMVAGPSSCCVPFQYLLLRLGVCDTATVVRSIYVPVDAKVDGVERRHDVVSQVNMCVRQDFVGMLLDN